MAEMRVIVAGAGGRMGRTLIHAVAANKDLTLVGALEAAGSAVIGRDAGELAGLGPNGIKVASDAAPLLKDADGLIEFTIPAATLAFAELTAAAGLVHVIGTTGHSAEEEKVIAAAANRARIVKSGNMSLGVNLLAALVKRVAKTLDEAYDIEILEMHHNKKIDAPSGTALMLGRAAAAGRGIDLAQHSARGRDGMTGARCAGDIGFASLRGGTVVGDHTVTFAGPAERLEFTHRAEDRMIFARGALSRQHRLCVAARRHRGGRSQRGVRRSGRAHRAHPSGRGPHDLCPRRREGGAVGARQEARPLHHGRRARPERYLSTSRAQMIACRTFAETHSLTTTVAMTTNRTSETCVQASDVIAALSGRPMPPAPTRPSTVDSRMLMSQRNTVMPANAGSTCGTIP